jgi:hypothetical protein
VQHPTDLSGLRIFPQVNFRAGRTSTENEAFDGVTPSILERVFDLVRVRQLH